MTKRTPQIEAAIIDGFSDGHSLRAMCRKFGISRTAFLKWKQGDPDLLYRYEQAMLLHAEALVDDCIAIADDPFVDLGERRAPPVGLDAAACLRQARFRIDARLKIARIYLKRHEAIAARDAEAEAALLRVDEAEAAAEAAVDATARPVSPPPDPVSGPVAAHPTIRLAPCAAPETMPQQYDRAHAAGAT